MLFINFRLKHKKTILDWDKQHIGPIDDQKGVEQGGPNLREYYKVFGKPQLDFGNITVSAVGQADNTISYQTTSMHSRTYSNLLSTLF